MKHLLLTTIAALLVVGCGPSEVDIALIDATEKGNIEAVKQAIADGADVNAKNDEHGMIPLHYAALDGHKEIVELLIANGADVNAKKVSDDPHKGKTPLNAANEENHAEIANLIRKHGGKTREELEGGEPVAETSQPEPPTAEASDISIHDAAGTGNIEAVKQHLAAGTDVDAKNTVGSTALHRAAANGQKEIAELLIAEGANVNANDKHGMIPLHSAAFDGHKEIVELLIANGADVNAKKANGETPLDWANAGDKTETADLIRKRGGKTGEELKAGGK